jgi:hypothetical protein
VVPAALGRGRVSQSSENGVRPGTAPVAECAGLRALLGFLAIVAVRLLPLRTIARTAPETPATQVVEPELLETVVRFRGGSAGRMTADQFWRAVAGLGGFLGCKGAGDPGWQTLWRGWQRLQDLCWGLHQLPVPGKECG